MRRSHVFRSLMGSYLVILVAVLAIVSAVFVQTLQVVQEQLLKSYEQEFRRACGEIDALLSAGNAAAYKSPPMARRPCCCWRRTSRTALPARTSSTCM